MTRLIHDKPRLTTINPHRGFVTGEDKRVKCGLRPGYCRLIRCKWLISRIFERVFKIPQGTVFVPKAGWRRAAALLPAGFVGSFLTARCGDARNSPPRLRPKSLAAAPRGIFKQALKQNKGQAGGPNFMNPPGTANMSSGSPARGCRRPLLHIDVMAGLD